MKHLFVINPHSFKATGNMGDVIREIEGCFIGEGEGAYKIHISRYPRDAIAVVYNYISGFPKSETVRVYAVGGDGITFECLNGMVHFPNAELTCIPYGNANDFVRVFGDNIFDKFKNIKNLINAASRPMDIINSGSNYSLVEMNVGLIGQTMIYANAVFPYIPPKWLHKNIGLAYSLCAVGAVANKEVMRQRYTVTMDGEDYSGQYLNIHIANIACNGGSLTPSPYAKPDDGKLNVIFAKTHKVRDVVKSIGDYNNSRFEKHDFYIHRVCKNIEIKSDHMLSVEMDGEGFYAHEMKIEIIAGGIKIFAPEELDFADYSGRAYKRRRRSREQ